MISYLTHTPRNLKISIAMLAAAALVIALLAATLTTNPTQAQDAANTYTDPKPCGLGPIPGVGTAFMDEPHERTAGRFYLFDAYWEWLPTDTEETPGLDDEDTEDPVNAGFLHNNECPPELVTTTKYNPETEENETTATLTAENIDIKEAIFHVLDGHEATVVASASENPSDVEIALAEYPDLDRFVDAGDSVWWLRLDDPDTPDDETSDLTLGFSTRQFSDLYWAKQDDQGNAEPPLRYRLSTERHPTRPYDHPHFLAYRAPKAEDGEQRFVWSSAEAGVGLMKMEPGTEIENLQWIFTQPGTYEIWVELDAYVRRENPREPEDRDYDENWKPISENLTETSVARRYVFQVGTKLDENEPPVFGVNLTVPENSVAGTLVGAPLPIFEGEAGTFYYTLSGKGHEQFALEPVADPHGVQVKVADGANLDYETEPSYELTLSVTDRIDHESNPDPAIDDTLAVRIALEDEEPSVTLSATDTNPRLGERVTVSATGREAPHGSTPVLTWYEKNENGADWSEIHVGADLYRWDHVIIHRERHAVGDSLKVKWDWGTGSVWSNVITLHWREAQ